MPRERRRARHRRRRQRLARRDGRVRPRAVPLGAGRRGGEPRARGRLEPRRRRDARRARADPQRGRVARRRRAREQLLPRPRGIRAPPSSARGSSTPTGRCSGRSAATRRSGASRRSTSTSASWRRGRGVERLLRRWLRPRRGARRGVGDGLVHARPARGARGRRAVRRALLPLQRGGGLDAPCRRPRLVGRLHARRPNASTSAAPPTAAGSIARTSAATCGTSSLHGRAGEAERARRLLRGSLLVRGRIHRGERGAPLPRGRVLAWLG